MGDGDRVVDGHPGRAVPLALAVEGVVGEVRGDGPEGVPERPGTAPTPAGQEPAWWVTSRPIIVIGRPDSKTIAAASGSA